MKSTAFPLVLALAQFLVPCAFAQETQEGKPKEAPRVEPASEVPS